MQQVLLQSPRPSPTTLVASRPQLALMMVTLFAPSWLLLGREWIAMAGAAPGWRWCLPWPGVASPIPVVIVFAG